MTERDCVYACVNAHGENEQREESRGNLGGSSREHTGGAGAPAE